MCCTTFHTHRRTFVPSIIAKISICAFPVEHAASLEIICVLCSIWQRRTRRKLLRHLSVLRVYGKIPHLQLRAAAPKSNFPPPPPPVSRVRWSASLSPPTKWEPRRKIAPLTIKDALYQPQFGQRICRPASRAESNLGNSGPQNDFFIFLLMLVPRHGCK